MTAHDLMVVQTAPYTPIELFVSHLPDEKNTRSRLRRFVEWAKHHVGDNIFVANLTAYRDDLLKTLKPSSAEVHLSTLRTHYQRILEDRAALFDMLPADLSHLEKKAYVDELVTRVEIQLKQTHRVPGTHVVQERPDDVGLRLSREEVQELLYAPGLETLTGIRDTAIIALFFATGCREGELVKATVKDLYQTFGGKPCFHIPQGKGRKERVVPYGQLVTLREYVDHWLTNAGITEGVVFRRIYKGGRSIGPEKLSTFAIQQILKLYPLSNGTHVRPHDLRRTYARMAYESKMDTYKLQLNLGHASEKTTYRYIGTLGAEQRQPSSLYGDLIHLNHVQAKDSDQ